MTTKSKIQISPKRDAQLRRLAKKIIRAVAQDGRPWGLPGVETWRWSDVEGASKIALIHLRRAEIVRLRKGRK